MTDWGGVRERVLALGGRSELAAQLTAEQLGELEAWLGVELPEEYRSFLVEVGAGGAGPAYDVFPVTPDGSGGWRWLGDGSDMTDVPLLATAFPEPVDADALQALLSRAPDEEEFEDVEDFDPIYEAWDAELVALLWPPERTAGAICLCHYGCARRAWLVVSGPERGNMWFDPRCDDVDLEPMLTDDGAPLTFAAWYLEWLTEAEAKTAAAEASH